MGGGAWPCKIWQIEEHWVACLPQEREGRKDRQREKKERERERESERKKIKKEKGRRQTDEWTNRWMEGQTGGHTGGVGADRHTHRERNRNRNRDWWPWMQLLDTKAELWQAQQCERHSASEVERARHTLSNAERVSWWNIQSQIVWPWLFGTESWTTLQRWQWLCLSRCLQMLCLCVLNLTFIKQCCPPPPGGIFGLILRQENQDDLGKSKLAVGLRSVHSNAPAGMNSPFRRFRSWVWTGECAKYRALSK